MLVSKLIGFYEMITAGLVLAPLECLTTRFVNLFLIIAISRACAIKFLSNFLAVNRDDFGTFAAIGSDLLSLIPE